MARTGRPAEGLNHVCDDPTTFDDLYSAKYYYSHRENPSRAGMCEMARECQQRYHARWRAQQAEKDKLARQEAERASWEAAKARAQASYERKKREELEEAIRNSTVIEYCHCGNLVADGCTFCELKHPRLCDHTPRRGRKRMRSTL